MAAEHVGQFRADQQQPFGVGLRRRDLQQRDQLAGGRQPVFGDAVVGQLEQFLAADAGQPQHLDRGERPERLVVLVGQVAALARGDVLGPDVAADGLGCDGAPQRAVGVGDQLLLAGCVLRPAVAVRGAAPFGGGAHQHRQDRQPLAGPLVHAGLAVLAFLGAADLGVADRARCRPPGPPGRVVDGPVCDVEVEGAYPQQFLLGVEAGAADLDRLPVGVDDGAFLGGQVVLPRA